MKILALHGLRETPETSTLVRALRTTDHTIIAPEINPWKPIETWKKIEELEVDLVVGFSLGGFFASCLTSQIPRILINPALDIIEMLKERRKPKKELIKEYESLPFMTRKPEIVKGIFAMGDERIGLRGLPIYLREYPEESVSYISGGHNLTEEEFKKSIE